MTNTDLDEALKRIDDDIARKSSPAKRLRNAEAARIRAKRVMAATNKARRQMELIHPEEYKALYAAAFERLGSDDRYVLTDDAA